MKDSMGEQDEAGQPEKAEMEEEVDDEKMFEPLCDRLLSALSLLQTSLSEMLDVKDEIMSHMLPSSLQAQLAITSGRLFRRVSDLSVLSMELVRLVQLYSTPWEKKKEILAKLHSNYERKKNQLSVAIRRLQLLEGRFQQIAQLQTIGNWEKLFVRLMSTQSVGRRWKYRIESLRRKAGSGDDLTPCTESSQPLYETTGGSEEEEEEEENISVEELSAQGDGTPLFIETMETGVQADKETQDKETWTGDPLTQRYLCASVSGLQGVSGKGLFCFLTFKEKRRQIKLTITNSQQCSMHLEKGTWISVEEKGLTCPVSILNNNSSGVLRKCPHTPSHKAFMEAETASGLSGAEEVKFELAGCAGLGEANTLEVLLYRETEGVIAVGELSISQDLCEVQTFKVSLHPGQSTSQRKKPLLSPQISLFLSLHTQEETVPLQMDCTTQAWSLEDIVMEATGIDLRYISREELKKLLEPAPDQLEATTSPLSFTAIQPQYQNRSTSPFPLCSLEQGDASRSQKLIQGLDRK
ncbi:uncharacterized protein LOC115468960 [Microcaecilia unicolor]|uniref:Uncharacterized protein LOC115468960 n=1 Tax=Microcaecilia unicolor TaxID=1415580 RepID=A0A6P7XWV8_9AMPH|nr:uncharacterized protein LOC115468960 [Microcaecilia unicolor]